MIKGKLKLGRQRKVTVSTCQIEQCGDFICVSIWLSTEPFISYNKAGCIWPT